MHKDAECNPMPSNKFKKKNSGNNLLPNRTQYIAFHDNHQEQSIALVMLESYLSDICMYISKHNSITEHSYLQIGPIRNILNDCKELSHVNTDFFKKVETALNLLCKIYENSCTSMMRELVTLLETICQMITNKQHFSSGFLIPISDHFNPNLDQCLINLKIRINRLTPRIINIFKNILSPIKELEVVCFGFLKFYCEVDPLIPSPAYEDPILAMSRYTRNPGHIVQMIRKTKSYLDEEMISLRAAREVYNLIYKMPPELLAYIDKTLTSFIIWDLVRYALDYYRAYGLFHYKIEIFQKLLIEGQDLNYFEASFNLKENLESARKPENPVKKCKTPKVLKRKMKFSSSPRIRRSPLKSRIDEYHLMVQDKFQEFLVNKLRNGDESPKKSVILEEFSRYLAKIDQETIFNLWDEENLAKATLNMRIRF